MYLTSIVLHTITGVACFVGVVMLVARLRDHDSMRPWWWVYILSLVFLVLYMVTAIISHWGDLNDIERIAFPALGLLGWYMLFRAWQAFMEWYVPFDGWQYRLLGHVGFNLISLIEGFIIVAAIDLHAPDWLVVIVAVLGIVGGSIFVGRLKATYLETKPS
ncbi:MAG: hypothetical protein K0S68_177 [Candidatus Saccharibacteria bacterium]|jgi:hypothetical protein|nr:hypothetical protein [Candidatus Saccharibacteria bacterium]